MDTKDYSAIIDSYGGKFTLDDFDGNIERMNSCFLRSFLAWRNWTGLPTLISSSFRRGDSGTHGKGMAIDCLVFTEWLAKQPSAMQCWLFGTTWEFNGVGLYFDWRYWNVNQNKRVPAIGLHLDRYDGDSNRPRPLRWLRIDGLYYYQSLKSGMFYCRTNNEVITLKEAIRDHNERNKRVPV